MPPSLLLLFKNSRSVKIAPRCDSEYTSYFTRPMKFCAVSPNLTSVRSSKLPGASSSAVSTPIANRPALPVSLAPQVGSTMVRV